MSTRLIQKRCGCLSFLLALLLTAEAAAQESKPAGEEIETIFREALFAEEGERDFEKAEAGYREVLDRFTELNKMAATAAFRLGECYRKRAEIEQDPKLVDRAAQQFENVIRDFPEATVLVKLSRENLAAMGKAVPQSGKPQVLDQEMGEIARLEKLFTTSPDKINELPTPLHEAARKNEFKVARYLIEKGVDLNRGSEDGLTPLYAAAAEGNLEMAKLLVEAGADLEAGSYPPLHCAVARDREQVARALIEAGADVNGKNQDGFTAVLGAITEVKLADHRRLAYLKLLAEAGADLTMAQGKGHTDGEAPLHAAIRHGLVAIVEFLLKQGIDPDALNPRSGLSPLMLAIKEDELEIIEMLIEAGVEVNLDREELIDNTPLGYAVGSGNLEAVRLLLKGGAQVNYPRESGIRSPLHRAGYLKAGHDDLIKLLLEEGADPLAFNDDKTPLIDILSSKSNRDPLVHLAVEKSLALLPKKTLANRVWFLMPRRANPADRMPFRDLERRIPGLDALIEMETPIDSPPRLSEVIAARFTSGSDSKLEAGPDLTSVRILRRNDEGEGGAAFAIEEVDVVALAKSGDVSRDPQLAWGDIVWFDSAGSGFSKKWQLFDEPVPRFIEMACRRTVTVQTGEIDVALNLRLKPDSDMVDWAVGDFVTAENTSLAGFGAGKWNGLGWRFYGRFDLDLSASRLIRSVEGQSEEFPIDLSLARNADRPDFRIIEGDRLEIPARDPLSAKFVEQRSSAVWIARLEDGYLRPGIETRFFPPRMPETLTLGSVVARSFAQESLALPFPDFDRLTLSIPGKAGEVDKVETVSLSESLYRELPWGTVIEIPREAGKAADDEWTGLNEEQRTLLFEASKVTVTLLPEGLEPREIVAGYEFPEFERTPQGNLNDVNPRRHMALPEPLFHSLLSFATKDGDGPKWDLVRVTLQEAGEGGKVHQKVPYNCHLREGDIIKLMRAL